MKKKKLKAAQGHPIYNGFFLPKRQLEVDVKQSDSTHMSINTVEAHTGHANFIIKELFDLSFLSYI